MNITLSVDEQVAQRAREAAQKMGKSLNQAVRDYLEQLGGGSQREQLWTQFESRCLQSSAQRKGWRFNRGEVHTAPTSMRLCLNSAPMRRACVRPSSLRLRCVLQSSRVWLGGSPPPGATACRNSTMVPGTTLSQPCAATAAPCNHAPSISATRLTRRKAECRGTDVMVPNSARSHCAA